MGRPKGSKNSKNNTNITVGHKSAKKEKLNFTLLNNFLAVAGDLVADMSLQYREHSKSIILQNQLAQTMLDKFQKDAPQSTQQTASIDKETSSDATLDDILDLPADLAALFGDATDTDKDPEQQ